MNGIENLVSKLRLDRFFSSKLILAIDLIVSVASSIFTLMFVRLMLSGADYSGRFMAVWIILSLILSFVCFFVLRTYRTIIRHSTLKEFAKICVASFFKSLSVGCLMMLLSFQSAYYGILIILDMSVTIVLLLLIRVAMIVMYDILREKVVSSRKRLNIMVYGTDDKAVAAVKRLANSPHYQVAGYLNYGHRLKGQNIDGVKIYFFDNKDDIDLFRDKFFVDAVLFSKEEDVKK